MEKTLDFGTVEEFLRAHPQSSVNMLTLSGYVVLTADQCRAVLEGGKLLSHAGCAGTELELEAQEILSQIVLNVAQDEKNTSLFYLMTEEGISQKEEQAAWGYNMVQQ